MRQTYVLQERQLRMDERECILLLSKDSGETAWCVWWGYCRTDLPFAAVHTDTRYEQQEDTLSTRTGHTLNNEFGYVSVLTPS